MYEMTRAHFLRNMYQGCVNHSTCQVTNILSVLNMDQGCLDPSSCHMSSEFSMLNMNQNCWHPSLCAECGSGLLGSWILPWVTCPVLSLFWIWTRSVGIIPYVTWPSLSVLNMDQECLNPSTYHMNCVLSMLSMDYGLLNPSMGHINSALCSEHGPGIFVSFNMSDDWHSLCWTWIFLVHVRWPVFSVLNVDLGCLDLFACHKTSSSSLCWMWTRTVWILPHVTRPALSLWWTQTRLCEPFHVLDDQPSFCAEHGPGLFKSFYLTLNSTFYVLNVDRGCLNSSTWNLPVLSA